MGFMDHLEMGCTKLHQHDGGRRNSARSGLGYISGLLSKQPSHGNGVLNLYNRATLTLTKQTRFYVEMQTPTIQNGDGYNRYNINMSTMPLSWLEADLGWRYFKGHPIYQDSEQLETNSTYASMNVMPGRRVLPGTSRMGESLSSSSASSEMLGRGMLEQPSSYEITVVSGKRDLVFLSPCPKQEPHFLWISDLRFI